MAEADFEIDFYGDAATEQPNQPESSSHPDKENELRNNDEREVKPDPGEEQSGHAAEAETTSLSRQGVKRKSEEDDRPVDPGATTAVMISELSWWMTDDDVRGWIRTADCEREVKELTFSEHKVNGKSKG